MDNLILAQYRFQSEFEPDDAAALWCEIIPYSDEHDRVSISANMAINDPRRADIWLKVTSDRNRLYYRVLSHIKGLLRPSRKDTPQDRISRESLIKIAAKLGERPLFLFGGAWPSAPELTLAVFRYDKIIALKSDSMNGRATYGEIGLINKNTGESSKLGAMLYLLAEKKGKIPSGTMSSAEKKALNRLSEALQKFFQWKTPPIFLNSSIYQARFTIEDGEDNRMARQEGKIPDW